jgi:cell division protein FtsI/penicillin-binding protein 2
LTLPDALAHSCNTYFIHLLQQFPVGRLLDLSRRMGLGAPVTLADDLVADSGALPDETELTSDAARANLAFGQGRLTATPLQIAAATAVIAGDGMYREPRLVQAVTDDDGVQTRMPALAAKRALSPQIARRVRELLVYAASQTSTLTIKDCGGKTATAQTGIYQNGREVLNTWYSGFFPADSPRYVLTIVWEDGRSGARDCVPIFQKIAESLLAPQTEN